MEHPAVRGHDPEGDYGPDRLELEWSVWIDTALIRELFPVWARDMQADTVPGTNEWKDAVIVTAELYVTSVDMLENAAHFVSRMHGNAMALAEDRADGSPAYPAHIAPLAWMTHVRWEAIARITSMLDKHLVYLLERTNATFASRRAGLTWTERKEKASHVLHVLKKQFGPPWSSRPAVVGETSPGPAAPPAILNPGVVVANMATVRARLETLAVQRAAAAAAGGADLRRPREQTQRSILMEQMFGSDVETSLLREIADFAGDRVNPFRDSVWSKFSRETCKPSYDAVRTWLEKEKEASIQRKKEREAEEAEKAKRARRDRLPAPPHGWGWGGGEDSEGTVS
jgi:hypothetical protein